MQRKLTRKEKVRIQNGISQPIVIEQGTFVKKTSYLLLIMGGILGIYTLLNFELSNVEINATYIIVLIIVILFFIWMFILLPFHLITTTKIITIKNKKITIESNKEKYSINTSFDKLIWWKKVYNGWGDELQLKFDSKKISLSNLEFSGLFQLEKILKHQYVEKKR